MHPIPTDIKVQKVTKQRTRGSPNRNTRECPTASNTAKQDSVDDQWFSTG